MDEVKLLLDRYNLADPALEPASFTDPNLQALYDQLVAQGSISLTDALKVGAAIEEIDILDLQTRLAQTDNADIQQVFNNLMMGSYNHLNAFASVLLAQTGETYQPQYLSAEAYAAIVTGQMGNGSAIRARAAAVTAADRTARLQASAGTGVPQSNADITGASTITGTVSAYDLVSLTVLTSDGQIVVVQLGNSQYAAASASTRRLGRALRSTASPVTRVCSAPSASPSTARPTPSATNSDAPYGLAETVKVAAETVKQPMLQ